MGITDTAKWRAVYNDGTTLYERGLDGKEHAFKEIDMKKLEAFELINDQGISVCQVKMGNGKRLIFARRNLMTTGQLFKKVGEQNVPIPTKSRQRIIILGWQKTVNSVNTKAIFYLLPDGRIEMDDEWKEDALHSQVNTPGLIQEKPKQTFNSLGEKPADKQPKSYHGSNESAFNNKS